MTALLAERSNVHSIMDEIVHAKRDEVDRRQRQVPVATLLAERAAVARPVRDLLAALSAARYRRNRRGEGTVALQRRILREGLDFGALARTYERGRRRCHLRSRRPRLFRRRRRCGGGAIANGSGGSTIPVIYKDFILDPYQVDRGAGAGRRCDPDRHAGRSRSRHSGSCSRWPKSYGLGCHRRGVRCRRSSRGAVLKRARASSASTIAIWRPSPSNTGRADRMRADLPAGIVTIAESGIFTGEQVRRRRPSRVPCGPGRRGAGDIRRSGGNGWPSWLPAAAPVADGRGGPGEHRPDAAERPGYYGAFGGQFVAENPDAGARANSAIPLPGGARRSGIPGKNSTCCWQTYVGRPSPLSFARRLTAQMPVAPGFI